MGEDPLFHLLAGGVMLGAFFMATDYVTTPVTPRGRLIFGDGLRVVDDVDPQVWRTPGRGLLFDLTDEYCHTTAGPLDGTEADSGR